MSDSTNTTGTAAEVATAAETTPPEGTEDTPQDLDGYKALTEKLREEIKAAKSDRTPQSEKDAKAIVALKRQLKELEPRASEYDRLAAASKTDLEKAQDAINQEKSRASTVLQRLALAEIRAALAGVVDNPDAIAEDLNLSKFVDDDGEVNTEAIAALKAKYGTFSAPRKPKPDASQGSSGAGTNLSDPAQAFAQFIKSQAGS